MARAKRDDNFIPALLAENDSSGLTEAVLKDNSTGGVYVHIVGTEVGAAGGTSSVDDSAFTAGSGSGTPIMGFATSDAVNAGDVGVLAMDTNRNLKVSIEADNAGIGGGIQYTEDATDASITGTVAMMEVAADAIEPLQGTVADGLLVNLGTNNDITGTVTANLSAVDNAVLDDIAADTEAIKTAVEGTLTVTGGGGGVEYTEGDTDATITGSVALMEVAGDAIQPIQGTVAGGLLVNLGSNNDVTVTGTVDLGATDNAVLDTIDSVLDTINAKLVTGTDIGDVTINNSTGAAAVNIQDGGNTITVDGTVAVTHAALTELGAAINSDKVDVNIVSSSVATGGTSAADDDDFTAGTTPGTPLMGAYDDNATAVTDNDMGIVRITSDRKMHVTDASSQALLTTIDADTSAIATDVAAIETLLTTIEGNQLADGHNVTVDNASLTVDLGANNDVTLATLPDTAASDLATINSNTDTLAVVGGGTEATALRVTIANNSTGVVSVDDNGGALTVDGTVAVSSVGGTVAVTQSGTWNVTDVSGTVSLPTGASTLAEQQTQTTALQLIDDTVYVDDADWTDSTSKHSLVGGLYQSTPQTVTDGDVAPFNITANGALHVSDGGGALTVDGTVTANAGTNLNTSALALEAGGNLAAAATSLGNLDNSVDGNYLNVNMNVAGTDVVSGSGTATGALRVELPTNGTGVIATVGAVTAITNALPAGTNAIGKLAANSGVDIGDVTLTAGTAAIGSLLPSDIDVTAHTNYARKYYTSAGAATDGIIWSPAAGKRWHVVTMYINVSAAATITLEDDKSGGDDPVWKGEIAANSGVVLSFTERYPMASGEDAADLTITTTAGNVYCTVVGYEV
jgi:hypothetical protein